MAFFLKHLQILNSFVFGSVEEEKRRNCVWEYPNHSRNQQLSQGYGQKDGIWDELQNIQDDSPADSHLVASKLCPFLRFVQVVYPFGISPKILRALNNGVLGFLENKLDF